MVRMAILSCTFQVTFLLQCPNSYRSIMLATQSNPVQNQISQAQDDSNQRQPQSIHSIETIGTITAVTAT